MWQSNIRNKTLTSPAFERSRRDFENLRRFAVREDLFITTCNAGDGRFVSDLPPLFDDYLHGVPLRFDGGASSKVRVRRWCSPDVSRLCGYT